MRSKKDIYCFDKNINLKDFYEPGIFWEAALKKIEHEFNEHGICKFRSNEVNLSFFVPTYGCPGNGFSTKIINKLYSSLKKT